MQRFYVVNEAEVIVGEGVRFAPDENAVCWVKTTPLAPLTVGRVYRATTAELDELFASMTLHLYWLDGLDVPVPRGKESSDVD